MLLRILVVILNSYLVSGIVLAPIFIIATVAHVSISRDLVVKMIGWGAAGIVFAIYAVKLAGQTV